MPSANSANRVTILLLGGILATLATLVVLVAFLIWTSPGPNDKPGKPGPTHQPGEVAKRSEVENLPDPPPPVQDPNRIRETAQEGKAYHSVLKFGVTSRVEDKDWGIKEVVNLAYVAETSIRRKIEKNDGKTIVELRHFDVMRSTKLESKVELSVDLGVSNELVLMALGSLSPELAESIVLVGPTLKAILEKTIKNAVDDNSAKAWGHFNSLSGKTVRVTFVDGQGVTSIEPVGCTLNSDESSWVFSTSVLSDYYLMPELNAKPGAHWKVDGQALGGFIDPELRGHTSGTIGVQRLEDSKRDGKDCATVRIESGNLVINRSDAQRRRVGSFTPRGTFYYAINDRIVEHADLEGTALIEDVSKDHLLFEAVHRVTPVVTVKYWCTIE